MIFVPVSCEHADNFDFHTGLTWTRSHVNGALVKCYDLIQIITTISHLAWGTTCGDLILYQTWLLYQTFYTQSQRLLHYYAAYLGN